MLKIKRLSLLKSPHINKTSQEQFENRVFKKQFIVKTTKDFKYLVFLKKLNSQLFPDVNIKLKCVVSCKSLQKLSLNVFNPNYNKFRVYYCFKVNYFNWKSLWLMFKKKISVPLKLLLSQKSIRLIKLLDVYGESFKNMFE